MEFVSITTADVMRLHGLFKPSSARQRVCSAKGSIDAAVIVHGLAGNFYSSRLLSSCAETLLALGISVVLVNTRGHDMINTVSWAGRAQSVGAALENVDECRFDLNAWADFLVERGYGNVLFFGHSLGAIKSLYATAFEPHRNVSAIVGLSPTRLSYSRMIELPSAEIFRQTMDRCRSLVAENRGEDPIQVQFPVPTWMSPRCYLDKYGPEEKFNWLRFIDQISIPTLLLFGEKELALDPAFAGVAAELEPLKKGWNPYTLETIAAADHFYTAQYAAVDEAVTRWLVTE